MKDMNKQICFLEQWTLIRSQVFQPEPAWWQSRWPGQAARLRPSPPRRWLICSASCQGSPATPPIDHDLCLMRKGLRPGHPLVSYILPQPRMMRSSHTCPMEYASHWLSTWIIKTAISWSFNWVRFFLTWNGRLRLKSVLGSLFSSPATIQYISFSDCVSCWDIKRWGLEELRRSKGDHTRTRNKSDWNGIWLQSNVFTWRVTVSPDMVKWQLSLSKSVHGIVTDKSWERRLLLFFFIL